MKSHTSGTFHLSGLPRIPSRAAEGGGSATGAGGGGVAGTFSLAFTFFSGGSRLPLDLIVSVTAAVLLDPGGRPGRTYL